MKADSVEMKKKIMETCSALLEEKNILKLSVGEICKAADVSGRTFYNYFLDKHDLVYKIYLDLSCGFWSGKPPVDVLSDYFVSFRDFMLEHTGFFNNVLCYSGQNCLLEYIKQQVLSDCNELICRQYPEMSSALEANTGLALYIEGYLWLMQGVIQGRFPAEILPFPGYGGIFLADGFKDIFEMQNNKPCHKKTAIQG